MPKISRFYEKFFIAVFYSFNEKLIFFMMWERLLVFLIKEVFRGFYLRDTPLLSISLNAKL